MKMFTLNRVEQTEDPVEAFFKPNSVDSRHETEVPFTRDGFDAAELWWARRLDEFEGLLEEGSNIVISLELPFKGEDSRLLVKGWDTTSAWGLISIFDAGEFYNGQTLPVPGITETSGIRTIARERDGLQMYSIVTEDLLEIAFCSSSIQRLGRFMLEVFVSRFLASFPLPRGEGIEQLDLDALQRLRQKFKSSAPLGET